MPTIAALCQAGELEAAYRQAKAALDAQPDSIFGQADMHLAVLSCLKKYVGQADAAATARWVRQLAALSLPPHAGHDEQLCWEMRKLLATLAKRQYPPYAEVAELLQTLPLLSLAPVALRERLIHPGRYRQIHPLAGGSRKRLRSLRQKPGKTAGAD